MAISMSQPNMNFDLPPTASCTSVGIRATTFMVVPCAKKKREIHWREFKSVPTKNVILFDYLESCETLEEIYSYA